MDEVAELTDEQINSLVDGMNVPVNEEMPESAPAEAPPAPDPQDFMTLTVDGKEVKGTKEQIQQWASQGHNYGRHMNEFKQKQTEFESRQGQFNEKYGLYEKIDQYAQNNPDWWTSVQSSFNQQGQQASDLTQSQPGEGGQLDPVVNEALTGLRNEISELRKYKEQLDQEKTQAQQAQEDKELESQVHSVRELYPDLDWSSLDNKGQNLELRTLEHAKNLGTQDFRAAFKDMMFDELMGRATNKAKDEAVKTIQRNNTLGLLGETPEPLKKVLGDEYDKTKGYDDILADAITELGIA